MKPFQILLFLSLFFACNADQQSDKKTSDSADEIQEMTKAPHLAQWLTWDGNGKMPHVVLVSGDEEYRSEEALPQLAKILSTHHGFKCTVLFAQDPEHPGIVDPNYVNNIPGLEQLADADMMILFTRFRALPDEQMKPIDDFLKSGKPVIGIRTATHAFMFGKATFESSYKHYGNYYEGEDEWKDGFGRLVMGEHWISHHGKHGDQSTKGLIAEGAKDHPITNGIEDGDIWGPTDVYGVRLPLPGDSKAIILGQVIERELPKNESDVLLGMRHIDKKLPIVITPKDGPVRDKNKPMMPVAWTKTYQIPGGKPGKCFSTTIGASADLLMEGTRRLIVNGVFWGLGKDVPAKANVDLVGTYIPSRFAFHKNEYWAKRNIKISTLK